MYSTCTLMDIMYSTFTLMDIMCSYMYPYGYYLSC
jgi:hypothetical protein